MMTDTARLESIAQELNIPLLTEFPEQVDDALFSRLPFTYARDHEIAPIREEKGRILIATANPLDHHPLQDLRLIYGKKISLSLADSQSILDYINRGYSQGAKAETDSMTERMDGEMEGLEEDISAISHDLLVPESAVIIRIVNLVILQALKEEASDIHIEPFEQEVVIRFRIDGMLYNHRTFPKKFHPAVISRIKIMCTSLDIAEKRRPQDGRTKVNLGNQDVDVRVSVLPTSFGERVVMRLLKKDAEMLSLDKLVPSDKFRKKLKEIITHNHGIILITGPTGSGKTTTLYSALNEINAPTKNIITVEDPVEYQLKGIGQIQVNPKINLTFANGLRSILRQDPDVIMVGEIRDKETAEISIHASLTGHLVFSTLHTNDSVGAVARLMDMDVEPFLLSSSLIAVIAQRLIRLLCPDCKEAYRTTVGQDKKPQLFYKKKGCDKCLHTGYKKRVAVFEILEINDDIRDLVNASASSSAIRAKAMQFGMETLRRQAMELVVRGETSIDEVLRVIPHTDKPEALPG